MEAKGGETLEDIAQLLSAIELMELKIEKRGVFKEKKWTRWEAQSYSKRDSFQHFKNFLLAATQAAHAEL